MVLSNPYRGIRRKGRVGKPLPAVECRIIDDDEAVVTESEVPGELRVKVLLVHVGSRFIRSFFYRI
jgi:acyl-coenzyme A synthetase/AMP-(fatty) acid ligase